MCTSLVRHQGGIFNEVHKEAKVGMDPSILEWHKLNSFANTWRNSENATDVCSEFDDNRQCVLSKFLKLPRAGNIL